MKTGCIATVILAVTIAMQADGPVQTPVESRSATKTGPNLSNGPGTTTTGTTWNTYQADPSNLRDYPAYAIPFPIPSSGFRDNPNSSPVKVGALPEALRPMGPPKPLKMINLTTKSENNNVELPVHNVVSIPMPDVTSLSANKSYESTTVSPFIEWIQSTKNASDIAKQQRQVYEQSELRERMSRDTTGQDLFLNIRFPYVGNQDLPPSGGAVIYSVPLR